MTHHITRNNPEGWLELIWHALERYRDDHLVEGFEPDGEEWDDLCTAMAWIAEELGVEYPHPE